MAVEQFGEWMRKQRQDRHVSQAQLAKRIGWSATYICTIERGGKHSGTGKTIQPSREFADALADALGVDRRTVRVLAGYAADEDVEGVLSAEAIIDRLATKDDIDRIERLLQYLIENLVNTGGQANSAASSEPDQKRAA